MAEAGLAGLKNALGEGARPNKYRITFNRGGANQEALVKAGSIPGHTIGTAEVYSQGRKLPIAGDSSYDTWDCTFMNDSTLSNNSAIHEWMRQIDEYEGNYSDNASIGEYAVDVTVVQLDRRGGVMKTFVLHNAWPTTIAAVDLASDSNDTVSETAVTFNYSHYTVE